MSDPGYEARVEVINRIITDTGDPGTAEQVAIGLRELAEPDTEHPAHHSMGESQRCVTCQARIFLHVLESKRPEPQ